MRGVVGVENTRILTGILCLGGEALCIYEFRDYGGYIS